MARRATPLTARQVVTLKQGIYGDGNGLFLVVKESGSRSWEARYQLPGQKRRSIGLGALDRPYGLAEAREKTREIQKNAKLGIDALVEKQQEKAAALAPKAPKATFRFCAEGFHASRKATWSARHAQDWLPTLERHVYPHIGDKSVQDIDLNDMLAVLQPIWLTIPETANRVRNRIEQSLDWAIAMEHRTNEVNPARWAGRLKMLLVSPSKAAAVARIESGRPEHFDALPWQQIPALMAQLRERQSVSARALMFTILTASRTSQASDAVWDEIDFDNRIWTIPGKRMKGGQQHRVPLTERALEIIAVQKEFCHYFNTPHLFPGVDYHRPIHRNSMYILLTRTMGYHHITVHGFRSTFRQWIAEATKFSREAAEMALAHTLGGVEGAYQRSDLLDERRLLMEAWEKYIYADTSSVVALPMRAVQA